jgi:citronellyl-CoA dehydrogenase
VPVIPPRRDSLPDILAAFAPDASGRQVWAALGAAGLLATVYRNGRPAAGVDPHGLGELLAAVDSRVGMGSTLGVCVQLATAIPLLATGESLPPAVLGNALAGNAVVALAATDAASGSDLAALGTEVKIEDNRIVVNGMKRWITNATQSDHLLVLARHRPGRHFSNFTWVLVPAGVPGVSTEPADTQLFDGSGTGHIRLDCVRLPREYIVGRPGRGLASFAAHIAVERLAGALWGVALCRRVLVETKQRLLNRQVGDASLWHLNGVRQRFAACLVLVRQLHALTAELGDRVTLQHDTTAAAMLKSIVATTLERVLAECAQLQGAEGFATGGVQHLRAQAALFGIGGGATEVVLSTVGDSADAILAELTP